MVRQKLLTKQSKTPNRSLRWPLVSVVIPAYNEEKFIAGALKSLQQQDYPGQYEVIVVDNRCTDRTAAIAKEYGARVVYEETKGVQYARQRGFEAAKGEFIASTDADDILHTDWLTLMAEELLRDDTIMLTGGWFRLQSGPIMLRLIVNYLSTPTILFFRLLGIKYSTIGQNFMVRAWVFQKVDGFNGLNSMNEDLLLAHRIAKLGQVKLHTSGRYAVITSPRRWKNGFIMSSLPYLLNALAYGFFKKLVYKQFTDIREEPTAKSFYRRSAVTTGIAIVLIGAFLTLPISPAKAKISPYTNKVKQQVISKLNETKLTVVQETAEFTRTYKRHQINSLNLK